MFHSGRFRSSDSDTKASQSVYYQPSTGLLLIEQEDSRKVSIDSLREDNDGIDAYAVVFYPRTYKEQRVIESTPGVSVSFVPFGYMPVGSKEDRQLYDRIIGEENESVETRREIIYDTDTDDSCEEKLSLLHLPALYVEWPKEKPFPERIPYRIAYGITRRINPDLPIIQYGYALVFSTPDSVLNDNVRLKNLRIRVDMGGGVYELKNTDGKGHISVEKDIVGSTLFPSQYTLTAILSSNDWTIADNDTTSTPIHIYLGSISSWETGLITDTVYVNVAPFAKELLIHRAVDYYFNTTHTFSSTININESNTIYAAMSYPSYTANGYSSWDTTGGHARIRIFNNNKPMSGTMGTILHEMGHARRYYAGYIGYAEVLIDNQKLIRESYASFIGWLLSRTYYESIGFVFNTEPQYRLFNPQHRQYWLYNYSSNSRFYSPLLIDFCDNYNQRDSSSVYVNDNISNVSPVYVEAAGKTAMFLSNFITNMSPLCGVAFSQNDFDEIMYNYTQNF